MPEPPKDDPPSLARLEQRIKGNLDYIREQWKSGRRKVVVGLVVIVAIVGAITVVKPLIDLWKAAVTSAPAQPQLPLPARPEAPAVKPPNNSSASALHTKQPPDNAEPPTTPQVRQSEPDHTPNKAIQPPSPPRQVPTPPFKPTPLPPHPAHMVQINYQLDPDCGKPLPTSESEIQQQIEDNLRKKKTNIQKPTKVFLVAGYSGQKGGPGTAIVMNGAFRVCFEDNCTKPPSPCGDAESACKFDGENTQNNSVYKAVELLAEKITDTIQLDKQDARTICPLQ